MENNLLNNPQDVQVIDGKIITKDDLQKRVVYRDEEKGIADEGTLWAWNGKGVFVSFLITTNKEAVLSVCLCTADNVHFI